MKKIVFRGILVLLFAVLLTACGTGNTSSNAGGNDATSGASSAPEQTEDTAAEITVTHQLGEAVVKKNPETVVVFDFGALDILDNFGVEVAGVAKSGTLPDYLSKYAEDQIENVGSLKEPDFEKIYSMNPDVIFISGRQSEAYEELNKIAPTIFVGIDNANYMESFTYNVKLLAEIFEKEEEAEQALATINEQIAELQEMTASSDKTGLITLTTGGKISAYGPGSRFGLIHDVFGVKAADPDIEASTHGMSVTFEYIAETNPDYLFVIDRDQVVGGEQTAGSVFDNELVNSTNAGKNGDIIYLDPSVWYLSGGGITSVSKQIEEVKNGIAE